MLGVDVPSMINGRTTAIARLTNNTLNNEVRVLVSTLRINATMASTVTCSGTRGDPASIGFSISGTYNIQSCIYSIEI